jgi:hypothetical protein
MGLWGNLYLKLDSDLLNWSESRYSSSASWSSRSLRCSSVSAHRHEFQDSTASRKASRNNIVLTRFKVV